MDIPSLFMIPSAVSSGKVHSVFPNSTDADFQFNRDSDATRVNSEGLIERVGYYSAERLTNGDFSSGSSNWNIQSGAVVFSNNTVELQGSSIINQSGVASPSSSTYKVTYTIKSTSGSAVLKLYNGSWFTVNSTVGTHTISFVPNSVTFYLRNDSTGNITIDNVSVKEVTGDRARLNYEIEGGLVNTKPSLLLEPQSTNSFPNSEDYTVFTSASAGTGTNPIITSNYSISPDGTKNADRIQFNRGSGTSGADTSYITKSLSLGTIDATLSIYLKTNDGTTKDVTLRLGAALFDYDVTVTSEWQRFTLSGNTNVDRIQIILYGNQNSQTADLSCFGTQVESLTYATSYIPTNGSTQTRAAETCNGAGTSSIFNDSEGILYCEIAALTDLGSYRLISLSNGTSISNRISILYNIADNQIYGQCVASSLTQAFLLFEPTSISDFHKIAFKYKANDFQLWVDGVKVGTDTIGSTPTGLSRLSFDRADGVDDWYGKVRDIRVYNTKEMTDSEVDILLTKITS